MDHFLIKLQKQVSHIVCDIHNKRAGVGFKARKLDFKIQACCPEFKQRIYDICKEFKLEYLKEEASKILPRS
jgi:hypothetical protein